MPYVHRSVVGDNFTFGGTPIPFIIINGVAADQSLGSIGSYFLAVNILQAKHAYLDLYIGRIRNSNGGTNRLAANCAIRCQNVSGGPQINAMTIPASCSRVDSDGIFPGMMFYGDTDILSCLNYNPGFGVSINALQIQVLSDSEWWYDIQPSARIVM